MFSFHAGEQEIYEKGNVSPFNDLLIAIIQEGQDIDLVPFVDLKIVKIEYDINVKKNIVDVNC